MKLQPYQAFLGKLPEKVFDCRRWLFEVKYISDVTTSSSSSHNFGE